MTLRRSKYFVLHTGYDVTTDLHHGFTFGITKAGSLSPFLLIAFHFNWPHLVWYNRDWALDEPGYVQGMPVYRRKPKKWLLRGVKWQKSFEYKVLSKGVT